MPRLLSSPCVVVVGMVGVGRWWRVVSVIGGGVAANEPWFVDQVRAHLNASLLTYRPVPLEVAQLGDRAGVIGAASLSR
jgi:predicted NBD/HSP70 family sugar kinase